MNGKEEIKEFFSEINLWTIGLENVRKYVQYNDYDSALNEYRNYLRIRLNDYDIDCSHMDDEEAVEKAELLLKNKISLCGSKLYDIGDPIDWFMTPGDDKQWQSHLGYMYFQNRLLLAYDKTGEMKYLDKWVRIIEDFIHSHPLGVQGLEYDESYPMYISERAYKSGGEGRLEGYAGGSWIALAAARRVDTWLWGLKKVVSSDDVSNQTVLKIINSLITDHFHIILNNARRYTPNQFLHCAISMIKIGVVLCESKIAPAAYLIGMQRLEEAVDMNLLSDGSDLEQSFNYNSMLPKSFLEVRKLFNGNNTRVNKLEERIKTRCNFLGMVMNPLKQWPNIAKCHLTDVKHMLEQWSDDYELPVVREILRKQSEGCDNLAYESMNFPFGGYSILRNGWSKASQYLFFKYSNLGIGHMHEDCNSIFLTAFGRNIIVDSGNYNYADDELSDKINGYFFSSAAHNTICIDDEGQNRLMKSERSLDRVGVEDSEINKLLDRLDRSKTEMPNRWHTSKWFDYSEGGYQDGYGPESIEATHKRQIIYVKDRLWILMDRVHTENNHNFKQLWQLGAEYLPQFVTTDDTAKTVRTHDESGPNILIRNFSDARISYSIAYGQTDPYRGWMATEYNDMTKSVDLSAEWNGSGDQLVVTLLYPYEGVEDSIASIVDTSDETMTGFKIEFSDGVRMSFGAAKGTEELKIESINVKAECTVLVDDSDGDIRGFALGCEYVANDEQSVSFEKPTEIDINLCNGDIEWN